MSGNYEVDFTVGYTFEIMEQLVTSDAKRLNLTIDDYVTKMKDEHESEVAGIYDAIIHSTNKEEIRILIEELLDSKCEWAAIERYDYERNNPE